MRSGLQAWWKRFGTRSRPRQVHWPVAIFCVCVSAVLHVLMIGAVMWGEHGSAAVHSREGMGASASGAAEEAITTLFFIEDSSAAASSSEPEETASAGKALQSLRVTILSPDSSLDAALKEHTSEDGALPNDEATLGEREARAALFGRYVGQIQARVERAWARPRSAIGASVDLFECRVRVAQSEKGAVLEVTLKECNGDSRWQLSLVNAIQGASPLPAPPDPGVFADSLDLSFSSVAYAPDRTEQGYEPPPVAALYHTTTRSP